MRLGGVYSQHPIQRASTTGMSTLRERRQSCAFVCKLLSEDGFTLGERLGVEAKSEDRQWYKETSFLFSFHQSLPVVSLLWLPCIPPTGISALA